MSYGRVLFKDLVERFEYQYMIGLERWVWGVVSDNTNVRYSNIRKFRKPFGRKTVRLLPSLTLRSV